MIDNFENLSRKIFNTKVFQKVASNVQKPIDAFVAELDISDMDRFSTSEMDLKKTKLGGQIIENFIGECKEKFPQVGQNKRYIIFCQLQLKLFHFFCKLFYRSKLCMSHT